MCVCGRVCLCVTCAFSELEHLLGEHFENLEQNRSLLDWSGTAMLVSALRSASRVQNTNTNCPHNIGLLSERG